MGRALWSDGCIPCSALVAAERFARAWGMRVLGGGGVRGSVQVRGDWANPLRPAGVGVALVLMPASFADHGRGARRDLATIDALALERSARGAWLGLR